MRSFACNFLMRFMDAIRSVDRLAQLELHCFVILLDLGVGMVTCDVHMRMSSDCDVDEQFRTRS
jgi:hypothetical protein